MAKNKDKVEEFRVVPRSDIQGQFLKDMLKTEKHHDHPIVRDKEGNPYWKTDPKIRKMVDDMGIKNIWRLFDAIGITKNDEPIRQMYRGMGYSLFGYWEIFYWHFNNPDAADYRPPIVQK